MLLLWHTAARGASRSPPLPIDEIAPVRSFRTFDRVTAPGLPQSTVACLYQDSKGLLWIGTRDGIAFFDGKEVQAVRGVVGAPTDGLVARLSPRARGGLWAAGTRGVHEYDGTSWTLHETDRPVLAVAEEGDGSVWLVNDRGELRVRRPPDSPTNFRRVAPGGFAGRFLGLHAAASRIYVSEAGGVHRVREGRLSQVGPTPPGRVSTFLISSTGTVWIGTTAGELYFHRENTDSWVRANCPGWDAGLVRALAEDLKGRIWAGGNNGRVCYGRENEPFTSWSPENGLRGTAIVSMLPDREGNFWFGYNGNGLQQWVGPAWSHRTRWDDHDALATHDSLHVFALSETLDREGFLAAVYNRGIWRWDGRRLTTFGVSDGLVEDVMQAVEPEPSVIWAASRFGLFESRSGGKFQPLFRLEAGFVNGVFCAPNRTWYAATSSAGVYVRKRQTSTNAYVWQPVEEWNRLLPDLQIRAMTWLSSGELWIGSTKGVTVLGPDGALRPAPDPALSPGGTVSAILELPNGEVWVGGTGGIVIRSAQGRVRRLTVKDGLPGSTVYSLAKAEDGSVWIGGSEGVGHSRGGTIRVYNRQSGLIADECNTRGLLVRNDGTVLVGTMASLALFNPAERPTAPAQLSLYLTEPRPAQDGLPVRLPASRRSLRVAWIAPWLSPDPVEYRTRIPLLSPDWSLPSPNNTMEIPYLPSGNHTVEIQARLRQIGDSGFTEALVVRALVEPYLWETLPARLLFFAALVAMVAAVVKMRTLQLARRTAWLNSEVSRRTAELSESNRRLQEAHHAMQELALRDPLTGLYNRRAADDRLQALFAAMGRQPLRVAVLIFDVDHLKTANDQDGHDAGDALLKTVATAARGSVRDVDIVARYGGDEFLIVCPEADENGAERVAERLQTNLRQRHPGYANGRPITISGGIAALSIEAGAAAPKAHKDAMASSLLQEADRALYAAKKSGRDRVVKASSLPASA